MPEVLDAPPAAISAPPKPAPLPPKPPTPPAPKPQPKPEPTPLPPAAKTEAPKKPMERLFGDLDKITQPGPAEEKDAEVKVPAPEQAEEAEEETTEESGEQETEEAATPLEKLIAEQKQDRKAKAWPLVKEWRNHAVDLEKKLIAAQTELSDLRTKSSNSATTNGEAEKIREEFETTKKRLQEVQEELKYTAYERSEDFKTQYVQPYEQAWTRALKDLKGLNVTMADGQTREIAWQDVQALANMEPDVRRKTIKEQFPDDVQEVTGHVKAIRELADKQKEALEQFRKEGDVRAKQKAETEAASQKAIAAEVYQAWTAANNDAPKHEKYGRFFSPSEDDPEGNQLLESGYKKADEAFSANPLDPKLTAEQRADVIRKQAAIRNRSAAFSRLVHMINQREKTISELKAQLEEFQRSEPGQGEGRPATEHKPSSRMDSMMSELESLAK